jgi:hypothetical protein
MFLFALLQSGTEEAAQWTGLDIRAHLTPSVVSHPADATSTIAAAATAAAGMNLRAKNASNFHAPAPVEVHGLLPAELSATSHSFVPISEVTVFIAAPCYQFPGYAGFLLANSVRNGKTKNKYTSGANDNCFSATNSNTCTLSASNTPLQSLISTRPKDSRPLFSIHTSPCYLK